MKPVLNNLNDVLIKIFKDSTIDPVIVGDIILVGRLPKEEIKTAGGLIMTRGGVRQVNAFDSALPQFVQVLAIGRGFYDGKEDKDIPLDLIPGNVIEVAGHAVNWFSSFGIIPDSVDRGTGVGITREPEYRIKFNNFNDYKEFMKPFHQVDLRELAE